MSPTRVTARVWAVVPLVGERVIGAVEPRAAVRPYSTRAAVRKPFGLTVPLMVAPVAAIAVTAVLVSNGRASAEVIWRTLWLPRSPT